METTNCNCCVDNDVDYTMRVSVQNNGRAVVVSAFTNNGDYVGSERITDKSQAFSFLRSMGMTAKLRQA